jgi:hypothetical protein
MTPTNAAGAPRPTARQLSYLRTLADRCGQTFRWPATRADASREIHRLRHVQRSSQVERELERFDWAAEAAAREANCDVPIRPDEVHGFGSSATWTKQR